MRYCYKNFTGGEISSTLLSRYDLAKYQNSLLKMENFFPNTHSNAVRRSGMRYVATLGKSDTAEQAVKAVLVPFMFSTDEDQNYVIVFKDKQFSVYDKASCIADGLTSPFAQEDLYRLSYAQVGDTVYIAHKKYVLHKLTRSGAFPYTWEINEVVLNSSVAAPGKPEVKWVSGSGSGAATPNYKLRYKIVSVDANGVQSIGSEPGEVTGRYPTEWIVGDKVQISWNSVEGAAEYNIYRESAGYYGYIGTSRTTEFEDNNYEPDTADTPQENWFPFADGNNPGVVAFHQQRMVLAGTKNSPQTVYMSRTGDFENFRKSRPLQDDDPIEYTLASSSIDDIQWVASFKDLLIGTSGAEYRATGSDGTGSAITAKGISIAPQSFWGSSYLFPIVVGTSILHAQRYSSKVRDFFYALETDGYNGSDLSTLTPHLFEGYKIVQWAFQQSPDCILWCVRDDGVLLAMSYIKDQQIVGWTVHKTDGRVKSVCRLSGDVDRIFAAVEREFGGKTVTCLEYIENNFTQEVDIGDAFFVDCGVTLTSETAKTEWDYPQHLVGADPVLLVDGSPVEQFELFEDGENGLKFSIPYPAYKVHIGLKYTSILGLLPFNADTQQGSTMGLKRGYGMCSVKLHRSVGGKYGTDLAEENMFELPFIGEQYDNPVQPFSGDVDFVPSGGQDEQTTLYLVQDKPLPMQILGIVVNIDFGQQG